MLLQLHAAILVILAATMVADVDVAWVVCSVVDEAADADAVLLLIADVLLLPLIAVAVKLLLLLTADAVTHAVAKLILAVAEQSCSAVACVPEFAECSLAADASHLADANHPADAKPLQLLAATKLSNLD
jgi:hypothetical protein